MVGEMGVVFGCEEPGMKGVVVGECHGPGC